MGEWADRSDETVVVRRPSAPMLLSVATDKRGALE
jgi:hypothetical protein